MKALWAEDMKRAFRKIGLLLLLAGLCLGGSPAFAERRVALIIGNSTYETAARVRNVANDAALMAQTIRRDPSEQAKTGSAPAKPQASGQIICTNQGCRPVAKGCRIEHNRPGIPGSAGPSPGLQEVCN